MADLRASRSDAGSRSVSPLRTPPVLRQSRGLAPRDLSSSIASNLATARGIRTNHVRRPLSPSVSKHQAPGSSEVIPLRDGRLYGVPTIPEHSKPNISATVTSPRNQKLQSDNLSSEKLSSSDEGFSRFYATFENILSKISAPLAFAGLPLLAEENTISQGLSETKAACLREPVKDRIQPDDVDLTKHISRAALRASARDDYVANDSFYVVPTTGHTVSYAHILSFDQKEKRRKAISLNQGNLDNFSDPNDDDNFVDARETPLPLTPRMHQEISRDIGTRGKDNKIEELTMENASLKTAIDKLSKRLHAFEISAQHNSMALAESMRIMRDLSPTRKNFSVGSKGENQDCESLKQKVKDVEENLRMEAKVNETLKKDNERLRGIVSKYRERWEKLKEGAKSRRDSKDSPAVEAQSNLS